MDVPYEHEKLLSARKGGHNECFRDSNIPERLKCSICTKVLRDPHLMVCCGQKYCISCLENWFEEMKAETCPHCRATKRHRHEPLHVLDKGLKSEIESLTVMCSNCEKGCEWVGELREVEHHLDHCGYMVEKCPNKCLARSGTKTKALLHKDLELHLSCYCELRVMECKQCSATGPAQAMITHECCINHTLSTHKRENQHGEKRH